MSDAAVARYRALLREDPHNAEAALRLARCHAAREEWMNARSTYELALSLRPSAAQRTEAAKGFERAEVAELEYRRTAAERERGEKLDRIARLYEEVKRVPTVGEARDLGQLALSREPELAIAYYQRALELCGSHGDHISTLPALAAALRKAGLANEAADRLQESIDLEPSIRLNRASHTTLVATLRQLGRLDEARTRADVLVQELPDDPYVLRTAGAVYHELGDTRGDALLLQRAGDCFVKAERLDPRKEAAGPRLRAVIDMLRRLAQITENHLAAKAADDLEFQVREIEALPSR